MLELFFREILNLDILSKKDFDFVKAKTKEITVSSYITYNNNVPQNFSKDECVALLYKTSVKIKNCLFKKTDYT